MKMNLPPFIEIYRALIATPSISATEEALDQSNESLINLLAGWFSDLGFNVEVQPVPERAINLTCWPAPEPARAACCWPVIPIPCRLTMAAGRAIRSP
jgi:acetylornithine deacetylase/succinyl-diaminopimelate desuccinylase-like protein